VYPSPHIWQPLDVVALVFMTVVLCQLHKLLKLQIHCIHPQVNRQGHPFAILIKQEELLE
jgi:hypothetical protein